MSDINFKTNNVFKKSIFLIPFVITLIILLPAICLKSYDKYLDYQACSSIKRIANNPDYMKHISGVLDTYFSSRSKQDKNDPYKRTVELYETTSILDLPTIDESFIGLERKILHYISISKRTGAGGFEQIGIWVRDAYLIFNVKYTSDTEMRTDWKNPIVECDQGKLILGDR